MTDESAGRSSRTWLLIVALLAVVALAWWLIAQGSEADEEPAGAADAEPVYEAGATDVSGGELIVTDPEETGVPVDLPETPMTNAPSEDGVERAAEPPPPPAE